MATAALTEPTVLAATKRRLFPADDESGYVVSDTQFAQERWIDDRRISADVRAQLAPFNHVKVGSGYPDLVGVHQLDDDLLAVSRLGEEPPLVAVEAKGYTAAGGVDVERGIVQAHDRLDEANAAFVAAPTAAIDGSSRTLARELNVGVVGVEQSREIQILEQPRVVGNRTTSEADALRFQASTQGVADQSFGLNHPKNYLGVVLARYHETDTRRVIDEHIVGAVDSAIRGAVFLGLVTEEGPELRLTSLGNEIVRFALRQYGSVDAALDQFAEWQRSRKRFTAVAPRWGELARRIVFEYPATELLVTELQQLHDDGVQEPSLVDLVVCLHEHHPTFTVELFIRGTEGSRERVLTGDGDLRRDSLEDGGVYHSPTVFQLKAMLYHTGILESRGTEPSNLDPAADRWVLREALDRWR